MSRTPESERQGPTPAALHHAAVKLVRDSLTTTRDAKKAWTGRDEGVTVLLRSAERRLSAALMVAAAAVAVGESHHEQ